MPDLVIEEALPPAPPAPLRAFWNAFKENRGALIGFCIVTFIVLLALLADVVAPHSPVEQFRDAVKAPPVWEDGGSWRFVLGTDSLGRDLLSRLMFRTVLPNCLAPLIVQAPGVVRGQFNRPAGCLFSPRCAFADERCRNTPPPHASTDLGLALCHYPLRSGVPLRETLEVGA